MPRQDSTTDQMLDVLAATTQAGHRAAAVHILGKFFAAQPLPQTPHDADLVAELAAADRIATGLGCYDAGDWLRRAAETLC